MTGPNPEPRPSVLVAPRYLAGDLVAGKYLLERVLGEGGMGSVWLAHNIDLDAPVAVKLLGRDGPPGEAGHRLRREARAEARLEHRAVVRVFDCGETERGDPFIVMELLEGMSFADVLDQKTALSATSAVRILLPIIDALCAAHDEGIVHRDVKPENIFLSRGARHVQPKIVDFGIAKLDRWDPNPRITMQGTVIGSPAYMAPEQARGLNDVDLRADIWAMCVVLYEAVTGSLPFRGDSYNAILRHIVEDEVTPLTNCGGAMAGLWPILARGFVKDRESRLQTMRELGVALAQFLVDQGVTEDICGDPLLTTWGVSPDSATHRHATGTPFRTPTARTPSINELIQGWSDTSQDAPRSKGLSSIAPTSLSRITEVSVFEPDRRPSRLLPAFAAIVVLASVVGASLWTQRLGAAPKTAHAAALAGGRATTAPLRAPADALASPSPVSRPLMMGPASVISKIEPAVTPLMTPHELPPKAVPHGWPASLTAARRHTSQGSVTPTAIRNEPMALNSSLGLKAPYR